MNKHNILQLITLGVLLIISSTFGCSCQLRHPQEHVCKADFVILARIRRSVSGSGYKVRIKKLFKTNEKIDFALAKKTIYSPPSTCEIKLRPKETYILTGYLATGKAMVNLCNYAKPWKEVSPKMRKGFKKLYQESCNCPIISCNWWDVNCVERPYTCSWRTMRESDDKDCQVSHAICSQRSDGSCKWHGGRQYRTCINEFNKIYPPKRKLSPAHGSRNRLPIIRQNTNDVWPLYDRPYTNRYPKVFRNNRIRTQNRRPQQTNRIGYLRPYKPIG